MKLTILCVGRAREPFILQGIDKYSAYLKHYADLEIREVKSEKIQDLKQAPVVRKREAEKLFQALVPGSFTISLDERGTEMTSHEFAAFIGSLQDSGVREAVFIVGGALGLDEQVTSRSSRTLALSRWTLTHEMARLVLLEQLYRAFTILTGKTYHY